MECKDTDHAQHVLSCMADGSTLWQDSNWNWFIGIESVPEPIACYLWTNGYIVPGVSYKTWKLSDKGWIIP